MERSPRALLSCGVWTGTSFLVTMLTILMNLAYFRKPGSTWYTLSVYGLVRRGAHPFRLHRALARHRAVDEGAVAVTGRVSPRLADAGWRQSRHRGGGGLAGLAAAAALGAAGHSRDRPRSAAFSGRPGDLLRSPDIRDRAKPKPSTTASTSCCAAASTCWISIDRLGVGDRDPLLPRVPLHRAGRTAQVLQPGVLPAPLHFAESFVS